MNAKPNNKIALITGAAGGIGRALAIELSKSGYHLFLTDINHDDLMETLALCDMGPGTHHAFVADITQEKDIRKMHECFSSHFDKLHLLINNAGISHCRKPMHEISFRTWKKVLGVNVWSIIYMQKFFVPLLRHAVRSHVVNVCSPYGVLGIPKHSAYCASKFAANGISEVMRHELAACGIRVLVVYPGLVRTNIIQNSIGWSENNMHQKATIKNAYQIQSMSATYCARKIIKAVRSNKKYVWIGRDARALRLLMRFLPFNVSGLVKRIISLAERKMSNPKIVEIQDTVTQKASLLQSKAG